MIKRYRPDPANPPQLIKSDLARIDRMTDEDIDYSDIPELGDEFFVKARPMTYDDGTGRYPPPLMHGEGEPTAMLMQIILDFCGGDGILRSFTDEGGDPDALYSYDQASYADAMIALHESGYITITKQDGARIWAKVLPQGWTLIDSLRAAQERNEAASWRHRP